jgi:hypothetical protein
MTACWTQLKWVLCRCAFKKTHDSAGKKQAQIAADLAFFGTDAQSRGNLQTHYDCASIEMKLPLLGSSQPG